MFRGVTFWGDVALFGGWGVLLLGGSGYPRGTITFLIPKRMWSCEIGKK